MALSCKAKRELDTAEKAARIAKKLDVTPSAVSQWRDSGVPVGHMETLVDLTANDVSLPDMLAHLHACVKARKKAEA